MTPSPTRLPASSPPRTALPMVPALTALLFVALVAVASVSVQTIRFGEAAPHGTRRVAVQTDNPLAGGPWGVYTGGADGVFPAWQAASGRAKRLLGKVALQPRVRWMGSWIPAQEIGAKVRDYVVTTRRKAGTDDVLVQLAVFMLWPEGESRYREPLPEDYAAYYRSWVDNAARAIGDARVALVLEPDLGITDKEGAWRPSVRWELARYAAQVFGALPRTEVYLDASSADWLQVDAARDMLVAPRAEVRHPRDPPDLPGRVRRLGADRSATPGRGPFGRRLPVVRPAVALPAGVAVRPDPHVAGRPHDALLG